jgi:hypothetical protein
MLAAVNFDDQSSLTAHKIDNVTPYGLLANELIAANRT